MSVTSNITGEYNNYKIFKFSLTLLNLIVVIKLLHVMLVNHIAIPCFATVGNCHDTENSFLAVKIITLATISMPRKATERYVETRGGSWRN